MKRKHLILLFGQLEIYVRAGLSINESLGQVQTMLSRRVRAKLTRVSEAVQGGRRLSSALAQECILPPAIQGLVESGESTGTLADALEACRTLLERQYELLKKCISALIYPGVIGLATLGLTIGLMEGIMPQIIPLLTSLHAQLPILTRITIRISQSLSEWWLYLMVTTAVVVALSVFLYRRYISIRSYAQQAFLRMPLIGTLATKHSLAIFFESLGSMIHTGIPVHDAYEQALRSIGLVPIRIAFEAKATPLIRGEPCSIIAEVRIRGMPGYAHPLLSAGERSGGLGLCMRRIASMLEKELDHALKRMTSLLEPILMIGMGGAVGSIALSIMMPIYDISKALQH